MKTQITGIIAGATLLAGSAFAEVELSNAGMPKLSISGWVDSNYISGTIDDSPSYTFADGTGGTTAGDILLSGGTPILAKDGEFAGLGRSSFSGTEDSDTLALNEVEVNFLFDFGSGLTAQFDIDYTDGSDTDDIDLEQAFFTYAFLEGEDSSLSVSAGRFLSYMGWESADLVNLYQFSYGFASGVPGYQDGVRVDYSTDMFSLGAAVVDSVYDNDNDHSSLGYELKATFDGIENLTLFAGYANDQDGGAAGDDAAHYNLWGSYQIGDLLVAAEWTGLRDGSNNTDSDSFLFMANYSVNDWLGFTARYSMQEVELANAETLPTWETTGVAAAGADMTFGAGTEIFDGDEFTLAVLLKAHDNLGFILEYQHIEDDASGEDMDIIAIEATLTF